MHKVTNFGYSHISVPAQELHRRAAPSVEGSITAQSVRPQGEILEEGRKKVKLIRKRVPGAPTLTNMYGLDSLYAKSHFFSPKTKNKFAKLNIYKMSCQVISINISPEYKGNFAFSQPKVKEEKSTNVFVGFYLNALVEYPSDPQAFHSRARPRCGCESAQYPNVKFC